VRACHHNGDSGLSISPAPFFFFFPLLPRPPSSIQRFISRRVDLKLPRKLHAFPPLFLFSLSGYGHGEKNRARPTPAETSGLLPFSPPLFFPLFRQGGRPDLSRGPCVGSSSGAPLFFFFFFFLLFWPWWKPARPWVAPY